MIPTVDRDLVTWPLLYPMGGDMASELFVVSARTNKRHHHRTPYSRIHVPLDMLPALSIAPVPPLALRPSLLCEVGP
jgi:hypothetical protein